MQDWVFRLGLSTYFLDRPCYKGIKAGRLAPDRSKRNCNRQKTWHFYSLRQLGFAVLQLYWLGRTPIQRPTTPAFASTSGAVHKICQQFLPLSSPKAPASECQRAESCHWRWPKTVPVMSFSLFSLNCKYELLFVTVRDIHIEYSKQFK